MSIDPVTVEVVRSAVQTIADEMRSIVMYSARSPILKEAGDLSCVITDQYGQIVAQGQDIPIHLGVMAFSVVEFLNVIPTTNLEDGAHYFTNDPVVGGNHLPDVKAIHPIFYEDQLLAFALNLAHWPDIGGSLRGSYVPWATELHQEGLIIPPVKVFDRNGPCRDQLSMILRNVRGPSEREGDILAQYAANQVTATRLRELCDRHGVDVLQQCFDRFLDESELRFRQEIARLPDGRYEGEDFLDGDGVDDGPIRIALTLEIAGDEIHVDFTGTDAQVRGPLNATPFVAHSGVYYAVRAVCGPDIPANAGCYRPITVRVPAGSVLDPEPNAPVVGGNHETAQRVADVMLKAFAKAVPERVSAGGPTTSGVLLFSGRVGGRHFTLYEVHGGGEGARRDRDGMDAVRVHMSNVMNTPAEVIEVEYPLRVEQQSIRPGSGGGGVHSGGNGFVRSYRVLGEGMQLTTMVDRCEIPPWGLVGGEPGQPYRIWLDRQGVRSPIPGKTNMHLNPGDLITIETAGGGGYGIRVRTDVSTESRGGFGQ